MVFRMHKVMNSITPVMRLITGNSRIETEKIREGFQSVPQKPVNPALSHPQYFAGFSGLFGTDLALEQTALKTQITILERREQ